jgi:DNA-binding transcriptional regulator YiaG
MENLKELRIEAGLTQMQLAARCNVSLSTVRLWEAGAGSPNEENHKRLLEVLNILPFADEEG